ncbi:MAG: FkbM family methyltransferase [Chloroflexi bacterium]|nr:FkbM family methyltransferase [Chloroflexota bacterium]
MFGTVAESVWRSADIVEAPISPASLERRNTSASNWCTLMKPSAIDRVLAECNIHPVLVDIGASDKPPPIWQTIARHSIYVGFDPDSREMRELPSGSFYKGFVLNQAITSIPQVDGVNFFLTHSPFCSSVLPPDEASLDHYLFADSFAVEKQATVPAMRLDDVVSRLALGEIDWLKIDSQGTDLRLFNSLADGIRTRVLALDVEPGLIDAYRGEDLFSETHRELLQNGFWLSNLRTRGAVRMRSSTFDQVSELDRDIIQDRIAKSVRPSPAWVEARYLRTTEWLRQNDLSKHAYALLWTFAMLDRQFGFALDVAMEWEKFFGAGDTPRLMRTEALLKIRRSRGYAFAGLSSLVPPRLKRSAQRLIHYR